MPQPNSPPVYADDTSLFDLGTPELFIVTVLRLWAAGRGDPIRPTDWPSAFRAAGVERRGASAFGSLWLSSHPGTSSMGKLLALSLCCTLAAAVLFQPALMGRPRVLSDT